MPDKVTEVWEVKRRTGKIRIDYTQNVINRPLPVLLGPARDPGPGIDADCLEELDHPGLRPDRWTIKTLGEPPPRGG